MASNWKYLLITVGTIGAGWAVMKGTVPSKDQMMEVISIGDLLSVRITHCSFLLRECLQRDLKKLTKPEAKEPRS